MQGEVIVESITITEKMMLVTNTANQLRNVMKVFGGTKLRGRLKLLLSMLLGLGTRVQYGQVWKTRLFCEKIHDLGPK